MSVPIPSSTGEWLPVTMVDSDGEPVTGLVVGDFTFSYTLPQSGGATWTPPTDISRFLNREKGRYFVCFETDLVGDEDDEGRPFFFTAEASGAITHNATYHLATNRAGAPRAVLSSDEIAEIVAVLMTTPQATIAAHADASATVLSARSGANAYSLYHLLTRMLGPIAQTAGIGTAKRYDNATGFTWNYTVDETADPIVGTS